jgi:hypothetical protein
VIIRSLSQLKIGDIISAELESGYLIFLRVLEIRRSEVFGIRVYNTAMQRESKKEYLISRKRLRKLIRRKNADGFDVPV